jgi:hypothetical protein
MVTWMPQLPISKQICGICMVGKQHKVEQLKQSMTQGSATPNQLICLDVFGPLLYASLTSSC